MMQPKIAAVQNILGQPAKLLFGSVCVRFEKDEIKLVSEEAARHAITRQTGIQVKREVEPGVFESRTVVRPTFKQVPVEKALKAGAKLDENPHVAEEARRIASEQKARDAERAEWEASFEDRFLAGLKEKGFAIVKTGSK